jgi:hypothetical protein
MVRAFVRLSESENDEIAIEAANTLLELKNDPRFNETYGVLRLDLFAPDITVDDEEAPYVPCGCAWCTGPGEDALIEAVAPFIIQYEVFFQ